MQPFSSAQYPSNSGHFNSWAILLCLLYLDLYTGRSTFCGPTEVHPKSATARGETKRLDFRGDVEARRRESLRTPGPTEGAGV